MVIAGPRTCGSSNNADNGVFGRLVEASDGTRGGTAHSDCHDDRGGQRPARQHSDAEAEPGIKSVPAISYSPSVGGFKE